MQATQPFTQNLIPQPTNPRWWWQTAREAKLLIWLIRQNDVPIYLKLIPLLVLVYIIIPIDLIPGFLPIIGGLDDIGLMYLGTKAFLMLAPKDVITRFETQKNSTA